MLHKKENSYPGFNELNSQIIQKKKELQEQALILNLLKTIDVTIAEERAELSKAVTDLKWKTHDLTKTSSLSMEALFYKILNRKKEWQEDIRYAHELALSRYEKCRKRVTLLESQQVELNKQLTSLANVREAYQVIRQQQIAFIIEQCGDTAHQLATLSSDLDEIEVRIKKIETAMVTGKKAAGKVQSLIELLDNPTTWRDQLFQTDSLVVEFFIEEPLIIARLKEGADSTQEKLSIFQRELTPIATQFWPPLSTIKPAGDLITQSQLKQWIYRSQQALARIKAKLLQLEQMLVDARKASGNLQQEQEHHINLLWRAENFPERK